MGRRCFAKSRSKLINLGDCYLTHIEVSRCSICSVMKHLDGSSGTSLHLGNLMLGVQVSLVLHKRKTSMGKFISAVVFGALVGIGPVFAQSPANPTPDNNTTRSNDVDPSDAPKLNQEPGQASDPQVTVPNDQGANGSSAGEGGETQPATPPPPQDTPPAQ